MKKSVSTRFKITKTGKILRRAMAQGHFLSKKNNNQLKRKKQRRGLTGARKLLKRYL